MALLSAPSARRALMEAIQRYACWQGEAQWKNGYRCGKQGQLSVEDDARYYQLERDLWARVSQDEARVKRAVTTYARTLRKQAVAKDGRRTVRGSKPAARGAGKHKTRRSTSEAR